MSDLIGAIRLSPSGETIAVQCGWSAGGQNVRIIDLETGIAGYATREHVAGWTLLRKGTHTYVAHHLD